ncbi:class I SAM-dependent methyltransferase [Conexibacter sp. SYSU D00693]|uniref:class I SAM-dependent methyltransferase n=1 Tax=Conexibacter sp. SYSU D00693 TaxID=2812560 RepID=UPI00196B2A41|nr:class I SAM-dependent methyltransferase [Conexibacter sp. SYSU D00693]
MSTADVEGPEWSARAAAWAEHWGRLAAPAREAIVEVAQVGSGTRLLDVGCGTGELVALAAQRGAEVAGIDAAAGMLAVARSRVPGADLREGPVEALPWPDGAFDVVTAVNALQFAADPAAALREAARVVAPGGRLAVCTWGPPATRDLAVVMAALGDLEPPARGGEAQDDQAPPPPALGTPGVADDLLRAAGLDVVHATDVDVPYAVADLPTLQRALVDGAGVATAAHPEAVRAALAPAAAPFRRPDGTFRFAGTFRLVVGRRPA